MKKTPSKIKKLASTEQVFFLLKEATKLNLSVTTALDPKNKLTFIIKNSRYILEQFPAELNDLDFLRIESFLKEYQTAQESESRVEELFNTLIGNLAPEHKVALNLG